MKATTNGKKTTHYRLKHTKLKNGYNINKDFDSIKKAIFSATTNAKRKAKHLLADQVGTAKEKSKEVQLNVAHYAKAKPFKTIGLAMLTGVCLGFLMRK